MNDEELRRWFEANKSILETAYLAGTHPWQQSGVGLDFVPDELQEAFVHRLLERYVQPGGRLLIGEYLGRNTGVQEIRLVEKLRQWKFSIEMVKSGHLEQDALAKTHVAVIRNTAQ